VLNRTATSTDVRGKTTGYGYDLAGNRTQVTDPLGRVATYTFDADGRMMTMVDARGNTAGANPAEYTTTYAYDPAGNQVQVTDPLGLVTKQVFDRVGNVTTTTNAKNLNTTFLFDSMNRVTRVTAPVVGATNWTYTNMGYVATRTDPLHTATVPRVASWSYDLAGRKVEQKDAAGRRFTFGYDVAGNQTQVVDANANAAGNAGLGTTTMTFDQLNRVTGKSYSDGTPAVSWTFDAQGRVASMTDSAGVTTYGYDGADRVNQIVRGTDTWTYTYDPAGNVTGRMVPGGANSAATFDDAGQLSALADTTGSTSFGYDPAGNMTTTGFPNGVTQARTYDRASRLAVIATTGPAGPIGGYAYVRDANGNPTSVDVSGPTGVIVAESMRNTYDNADRLTKTCFTTTTCATANQTTWTYNAVGSRITEKVGSAAVSTYTYDIADQLTAISGPGAGTFTYNPNGDQLTAGADVFTYNTARQTTSATVGGVTTQYAYDGNGNRTTTTTSGQVTQEVWDTVGGLPTLVAQRNGTGAVQRRYTYAGATPIKYEDITGSQAGYYQTDGIGSVSNLTTPTGAIGATYRYNPYGTNRAATIVLPAYATNPMRYTGQQLDPTGNYNLRARHYNPNRGAFTQTDPMPYGAGSSFEGSYVYSGARPTVMTDPSGKRFGIGGYKPPLNLIGPARSSWWNPFSWGKKKKSPSQSSPRGNKYDPKFWNDKKIRFSNNCYSYAINRPYLSAAAGVDGAKPQPGESSGNPWYEDPGLTFQADGQPIITCSVVQKAAVSDGLAFVPTGPCQPSWHRVFLVVTAPGEGIAQDYHWYREHADGTWSSKAGNEKVSNVDASGQRITSPESANRNYGELNYSTPCGTFCAKD
jgi:RHS repeat-associated protein